MPGFEPRLYGYQDVGNQLADHLRRRAEGELARTRAEKAAVASVEEFEARRKRMRQVFLDAIGGLPALPATVSATCTGRLEAPGFTVEKLLLETLPGVLATASLYVPVDRAGRVPAVLFLCGHHRAAKAAAEYQRVCRALVRAGLIVLALDPVGQGERLQYVDVETGTELVKWGTAEHCHAGFQCNVAGFGIARYFLADAMQAVTYLQSRPEVDGARLGVTGNSGGGTQACYSMFLDERLQCGAPCTFVTSREAYLRTGQAHDSEQNIRGALSAGLDYDDLVAGVVPRPVFLGAVASDFFPIEGTIQAYEQLQHVYRLYGFEDHLHMAVAPGRHEFSPPLRECVVRFFNRYLLGQGTLAPGMVVLAGPDEAPAGYPSGGASAEATGLQEEVWPETDLWVTGRGQVMLDHPGSLTVFDLNVDAWRRRRADGAPERLRPMERLREDILGRRPRLPLWVREVTRAERDGVVCAYRYTFSEPDIALPLVLLEEGAREKRESITVVALPEGTMAVATRAQELAALLGVEGSLLLFDPRGTGAGEQRPINSHDDGPYGTTFRLNYDAMMLGDSLLAMRAFDALRALEYVHRLASRVVVVGEGTPGLVLLAAAVLDGRVSAGRFRRLPRTFADLVSERFYRADVELEVHGLTEWPDVPDMLAALPEASATEWLDVRNSRP